MTNLSDLHKKYHEIIDGSFTKQDEFTIGKAIARSKKVLPRGRAYIRLIKQEVGA